MARVVAELGRPETPEETAARKAETSRQHRANQTVRNLVWSLVATLAVVLVLVLVVVRPETAPVHPIDYETVAEQAQSSVEVRLAVPHLPEGWTANAAELRTSSAGVQSWYIGFVTPSGQFIAFTQGIDADASWTDDLLDGHHPTGDKTIVIDWVEYDYRSSKDPGNVAYGLVGDVPGSTLVLNGTASDEEFATLATAVASSVGVEEN
jgi:hypothetical protein